MQDLIIGGQSIQHIYNDFVHQNFFVNRRYQRKLVWTIKQKQELIDSIQQGYPIPLILLTAIKQGNKTVYEIIDGLQRLDAITSFIRGDFGLNGQYFDLRTLVDTKSQLEKGELTQKEPLLEQSICNIIANYEIPFSIYSALDGNRHNIDAVFKRINVSGKKLTLQEIRQAAALSSFAQLVRRISAEIRGDASASDRLRLEQMKEISISSDDLSYGINIKAIPWHKQKILLPAPIRQSQDEEMVAHLLAYMLLHEQANPTNDGLDSYYNLLGGNGQKIQQAIQGLGSATLEQQFLAVYDEVNKLLTQLHHEDFTAWIFKNKKPASIARYYEVIFLAIYELFIRQRLTIKYHIGVAKTLEGLDDDEKISVVIRNPNWSKASRQKCIEAIVSKLRSREGLFIERPQGNALIYTGDTIVKNILTQSLRGEPTLFDWLPGIYPFADTVSYNDGEERIREIYRALTAMANDGPGSVGYIIVGVSKEKADVEKYTALYNRNPLPEEPFYILGIQNEATKYCGTLTEYYRLLRNAIRIADITPQTVKDQINRDIGLYTYRGKPVIVFRVEAPDSEPCQYNDKIYERVDHETREVLRRDWGRIYARFAHPA